MKQQLPLLPKPVSKLENYLFYIKYIGIIVQENFNVLNVPDVLFRRLPQGESSKTVTPELQAMTRINRKFNYLSQNICILHLKLKS
jgi:hypothetical protein